VEDAGVQKTRTTCLERNEAMFHKIKEVYPLPELQLSVLFADGTTKTYNMKPLLDRFPVFAQLNDESLFSNVEVDVGGYGIIWNDSIDLSCDELWENGTLETTPFDGLMSFADATELWGLSESTLRKAISYGKIVSGIDARKYGKQWVVTKKAMEREYGEPVLS